MLLHAMLAYPNLAFPCVLDAHTLKHLPLDLCECFLLGLHLFAAAGLHPFTEYSCSVQAGNSEGFGDWSSSASVRTAAAASSAPVNLRLQGEQYVLLQLLCARSGGTAQLRPAAAAIQAIPLHGLLPHSAARACIQ